MKAMSGELSLQTFHFSLADYPLLKEGEKKGGYRVMLWPSTGADAVLMINHTYNEDPVIAKLLNDVRFKRALSLAINREEINQLYALGLARATQYSPSTTDPVYEKRYSEAYSKFDPATANKLLDSIGLVKRDKDGYRLRPDGKRLTISILVATDWPMHSDICEMLRKYWKDIGIELLIQPTSFELRSQRIAANAHQIVIWKIDVLFYPHYINLARGAMSAFSEGPDAVGPLWRDWELSGGKSGVKPPEDWFKVKEYLEKAASSPSERERILYAKKMWDLYIKNLWSIGVLQQLPIPIVVKDNFRNVPDKLPNSWTIRTPVNGSVEQFFIKQ
jgi:peptide/nickel transport system substrate-binding protein